MRNLFIFPMVLWIGAASANDKVCPPISERVTSSIKNLENTWDRSRILAPNWRIQTNDNKSRSDFELYAQAAALIYTTGLDTDTVLVNLNETDNLYPSLWESWEKENFARLGQAALLRGRPVLDSMRYLKALQTAITDKKQKEDNIWTEREAARVAATGFLLNKNISDLIQLVDDLRAAGGTPANFKGTPSMIVEAALISGASIKQVMDKLQEIQAQFDAIKGWDANDSYLVLRATLIANRSAKQAGDMLVAMMERVSSSETKWEDDSAINTVITLFFPRVEWSMRSYTKVLVALIVSGQTDGSIGGDVLEQIQAQESLAPEWPDPDYAATAAAAVLGPACLNLDAKRFW